MIRIQRNCGCISDLDFKHDIVWVTLERVANIHLFQWSGYVAQRIFTIETLIIASIFGSKVDLQVLDPVFLVNGVRWCFCSCAWNSSWRDYITFVNASISTYSGILLKRHEIEEVLILKGGKVAVGAVFQGILEVVVAEWSLGELRNVNLVLCMSRWVVESESKQIPRIAIFKTLEVNHVEVLFRSTFLE